MTTNMTKGLIDRIFKEPGIRYELTEFETLRKPIYEILSIYPRTVDAGRDVGKTKYYLKSLVPFSSGKEEVQVYMAGGKSAPEEIVRQLWVYKLIHQYGYHPNEIDLEKSVQFGTEVGTKAADIIVYTDDTKETPKIIVECKKPKRKDGIEQLKSYMNAKGRRWQSGPTAATALSFIALTLKNSKTRSSISQNGDRNRRMFWKPRKLCCN